MANICTNTIKIKGDVKTLYDEMTKALTKDGVRNEWLGNFLTHLGMTEDEVYDSGIECRGDVFDIEYNGNEIELYINTAWCPMMTPVMMMCEAYAPEAEVLYTSIEPGCGIYYTNDPETENKYYCDSCDERVELYDCYSKDELKAVIEEEMNVKAGLVKLIDMFTRDYDVSINKMQFCEIEEL